MSHVVKHIKGQFVVTYCGRTIQKAAAGSAISRGRVSPYFYLYGHNSIEARAFNTSMSNIGNACPDCLSNLPDGLLVSWLQTTQKFLKTMSSVHIWECYVGEGCSGAQMYCGRTWDRRSMFSNKIGFLIPEKVTVETLANPNLCEDCKTHPAVQLILLAKTSL